MIVTTLCTRYDCDGHHYSIGEASDGDGVTEYNPVDYADEIRWLEGEHRAMARRRCPDCNPEPEPEVEPAREDEERDHLWWTNR